MPATPVSKLLAAVLAASVLAACSGKSSDTLMHEAEAKLAQGDYKAALIQLKNAVAKDEHNAAARFALGQLYFDQLDFASAEKEFRRARDAGYAADAVNLMIARALLAQREFQRVLDDFPEGTGNTGLQALRATAELGLGHVAAARTSLEALLQAAPGNAEVQFGLAQLALAEHTPDAALAALELALRADPRHHDSRLLQGNLLYALGKTDAARAAYRELTRIDSHNAQAHLALADIDVANDRLADARAELAAATKVARNNLQARYLEALIDFRENKPEQARDHLAAVLKNAPTYLPGLQLGGAIEYALGNFETAEARLAKVVQALPDNRYAVRLLAAAQLRLGRPEDASRTLAPALRAPTPDAATLAIAGEIAAARGDHAEAALRFQDAAQRAPDNALIRTELGMSRLAQGDTRALADLQTAAAMPGADARTDVAVIVTLLRQKQFDAALAAVARLEKKQGPSAAAWSYRGAAFLGKQDFARARDSFGQALKLDPAFFPAAANLAQLDMRDQRPADARTRFEGILRADPRHLNAMLALAGLAMRGHDESGYVHWLEKAATAHPEAVAPRTALARHLLARGDKARALAIAREAVNAQPDNPEALDLLGAVQLASGDTTNALGAYQKLADRSPKDPAPLLKVATAQLLAKDVNGARDTLKNALRLRPDFLDAQLLLGGLEIQSARYNEAIRVAREVQQQKPGHPAGFSLEGDVAYARHDYPAALAALERAQELAPSGALLVRQLQVYEAMQRPEAGEKRLVEWLSAHPLESRTRAALADSLVRRKQYAAAIDQYALLNKSTPNNPVVLNNLAWAYAELKDKRAIAFADQALKLQPGNANVLDTYGWLQARLGDTAKGLGALKKAQAIAPDDAQIQWHLAYAWNASGNKARARQELKLLLDRRVAFDGDVEARALYQQLNAAL